MRIEKTRSGRGGAVDFTLKSRRVMVVDNDLAIHSLMRRILSHWGCEQVEISSDGSSAVESYRCVHPDLVIMDVEMPEMDGHAAAEAIKRLDEAAAILLLTGVPEGGLARRALEEGLVKAVVPKPFGLEQLKMAIQEALRGKPLERGGERGAVA
jgi:two-component system chemotaxis response regulator CheY